MNVQKTENINNPPASAAHFGINLSCLCLFFGAVFLLSYFLPQIDKVVLVTFSLLFMAISLALYDLCVVKVHRRLSAHLSTKPKKGNKERLVIKLIGLYVTLLFILFYYCIIYTFFDATYLKAFLTFLKFSFPLILLSTFFYFLYVDQRQENPYDAYWHLGCFLTGRFKNVQSVLLREHIRVWFIKGFFTPYLFVILVRSVEALLSINFKEIDFLTFYGHLLTLFYTMDVVYGVLGYILTCRLLDTHIRSTEPTLLGWIVCLMCYGPFHSYFGIGLFSYDDGLQWHHWFADNPALYYFFGSSILFLIGVYCLATVAIGYRMSNLTYRGIITNGPYRFSKHPAYIGKVGSWWLISLPFLSTGDAAMVFKHTLALFLISFVYYLRAKTEENHLSNYPEYVQYANWINKRGIFSGIMKYLPGLQYSEKKSKRWGSKVSLPKGDVV